MTVCIAGICLDGNSPRFVICSDQRIETEEAGGEVCLKLDHAGDGWIATFSGSPARARDLVAVFRKAIMDRTDTMDSADLVREFSECAHRQKRTLVENYVQSQVAISYDYLLEKGRSRFPERHFDELMSGVRAIDLGCEVILSGFVGKDPRLFTITREGSVYREESFAATGSGGTVAGASLYRRRYRGHLPIAEAAYYIYEAKKLSEVASGVGQNTDMLVLKKSEKPGFTKWNTVSGFYIAHLESEYKEFGPRDYKAAAWDDILPGLSFREDQSNPQSTKADPSPPQPSPESPGGSGES
jgi:20S proteasome alpha/beta subunit